MSSATAFQVLGPVELLSAGRRIGLGPAKQRTVAASLLVDAGRLVTMEALIDRVWGSEPPPAARTVLYAHITRIRKALAQSGLAQNETPVLERHPGGYLLAVHPNCVDMHRFRHLVDQSRAPGCTGQKSALLLEEALGLWHGTALASIPGGWAARVRERLDRQRLTALTQWAQMEVRLGRFAGVVDRLYELIPEYPLAETLVVQLMWGLYLNGRAAEALDCYAQARQRLIDELGLEPGPDLRHVHQTVLNGTSLPRSTTPVPFQT